MRVRYQVSLARIRRIVSSKTSGPERIKRSSFGQLKPSFGLLEFLPPRPRPLSRDSRCSYSVSTRSQESRPSDSPPNLSPSRRLKAILLGKKFRPWTIDDLLAMFSWIFVGNTLFILIGTTTFAMVTIGVANSLQFQEFLVRAVGQSIGQSLGGAEVIFEEAIVPNWKGRRIRLNNVRISSKAGPLADEYDNVTRYDVKIELIELTLNLFRWIEGKGIIRDVFVRGVRGHIDKRGVAPDCPVARRALGNQRDFHLESLVVDDLMLTMLYPLFRPFEISVFHGEFPRFRCNWLLHDFLCAEALTGMYDKSLFTIYRPQQPESTTEAERKLSAETRKRVRFELHHLPVDQLNSGIDGPFGWITSGKVDVVATFSVPTQEELPGVLNLLQDTLRAELDNMLAILESFTEGHFPMLANWRLALNPPSRVPDGTDTEVANIICDMDVKLNGMKASVPMSTPHLSYLNGALIQPVVRFMNAHSTMIPFQLGIAVPLGDFEGAWSVYQVGLHRMLSEAVGKAIVELYADDRRRHRELKRIGLWSLQTLMKNILNLIDYSRRSMVDHVGAVGAHLPPRKASPIVEMFAL